MKIIITLGEVVDRQVDWIKFCSMKGVDEYAIVNGMRETTEFELTEKEAIELLLIKRGEC